MICILWGLISTTALNLLVLPTLAPCNGKFEKVVAWRIPIGQVRQLRDAVPPVLRARLDSLHIDNGRLASGD